MRVSQSAASAVLGCIVASASAKDGGLLKERLRERNAGGRTSSTTAATRRLHHTDCPSGDGVYCGNAALGQNPDFLYECDDGKYDVEEECTNTCFVAPAGYDDYCLPTNVCPYGDGVYCGNSTGGSLGLDPTILYECAHGVYTPHIDCAATGNACVVAPPYHDDYCNYDPCPNGNGLYCGDSPGVAPGFNLDATKLYECHDGFYSLEDDCTGTAPNDCYVAPPGYDDYCLPVDDCPYGNGFYCGDSTGGTIGLDPDKLYECHDGEYTICENCTDTCWVALPHYDDYCLPTTVCPYGDGIYCGGSTGGSASLPNTKLYDCHDGVYTLREDCGETCEVRPPYHDDRCP